MITLKTLHLATTQEVFDQIANHLLTQGCKSMEFWSKPFCLYRNSDGLKCAAGCLMADDEYNPDFEYSDWYTLVEEFGISSNHSKLIQKFQKIHDDAEVKNWKKEINDLALEFKLSTKVLDNYV